MHFPETETSTVTAVAVVSANPEVQAVHFAAPCAGMVWNIRKKLKRAIRGFFMMEV
jgi:hypothetical protein